MKSLIASLRALTLPFGAGTGQRIVLDGVSGIISIYNAANQLVMEIEGPGITMYDGAFPRIQMDTASGAIFAYDNTGDITLRIDEAGLILYENAVEKVILDAATFPGIRVLTGVVNEDGGGALTASGVDSDFVRASLVGGEMNGNGGFIIEMVGWNDATKAPLMKLSTEQYSGSEADAYIDATAPGLAGNTRTVIAADDFWIGTNHGTNADPTRKYSLPRGVLKSATITASVAVAASPTETDIGLSVTFTAEAERHYRFVLAIPRGISSTVANDLCRVILADSGGTNIEEYNANIPTANRSVGQTWVSQPFTGLSGSITRKIQASRVAGSGNVSFDAAAIAPATLYVEDLGIIP